MNERLDRDDAKRRERGERAEEERAERARGFETASRRYIYTSSSLSYRVSYPPPRRRGSDVATLVAVPSSSSSLGAALLGLGDGDLLGDGGGRVVPTLRRAGGETRAVSARNGERGDGSGRRRDEESRTRSGGARGERFAGTTTRRTKYCCAPYATSAAPQSATVYLSYARTNFFDAAFFPRLSSIVYARAARVTRRDVIVVTRQNRLQ